MKYDCFENDTYNLYTIETTKFKSCHLEVVFRSEASLENITYTALLMSVLFENSKKYPSRKLLSRRLAELYNVEINGTSSRVGETLVTNAYVDFLDPKYTDADTLEESVAMLFEMLLAPNADEFEFDEVTFERVKKELALEIDSLKEDPKQSSIMGAFEALNKNDVRSFNVSGDVKILESITPKKLYDFYKKFLETSARDIYLVGNLDMKMMNRVIRKYAKFTSIVEGVSQAYLANLQVKKPRSAWEDGNVPQTNLVQIYSFINLTERERDYVVPVFNMLWGSGSLESKLYKSLRGENSLCYNVNTYYQKYDRVVVLHTAIDDGSTRFALKLINNSLASVKKGGVSAEEIANVKNILENSLNLSLDSPSRLIDMYVFKNLVGLPDIEKRIDEIRTVSKDEVVRVAGKMRLALTYRMRGE